LHTQKMIFNSIKYSSLTNTKYREDTSLSQAQEQTIVFIFPCDRWRKLNWPK